MHDLVVHGGDGVFGEQQQQVALHRIPLHPVVDLDGQGAAPAALVGANEIPNGSVLTEYHGMALAEGGVELVGIAAQEGPDQDVGGIHQQFQLGVVIQHPLMVHQACQILEAGIVKQQQRLAGDTGPDEALADGGEGIRLGGGREGHVQLGDLQHVDVGDGQQHEGIQQASQQIGPLAHGDVGELLIDIPQLGGELDGALEGGVTGDGKGGCGGRVGRRLPQAVAAEQGEQALR
ncbi:hypothetical protein D3C78_264690 [compost metagenome]